MKLTRLLRRIPLVRRPFWQRDQALAAQHRLQADRRGVFLRHRPVEQLSWKPATVESVPEFDDEDLVDRIIAAYRAASQTELGSQESLWFKSHGDPKLEIHEALIAADHAEVTRILRDPGSSALFYGFETLGRPGLNPTEPLNFWDYEAPYDALRCLAEALAVHRLENPENRYYMPPRIPDNPSADELLREISGRIGFEIDVPNPFIGETGLATSFGVVTYRVVQALYQAWRVARLTQFIARPRVLEIGGGLGRTAYYAWQSGVRDYTIVDLPLTAVSQGYFLGHTLGAEAVCLFGESRPGIRVIPPAAFFADDDRYDLVVNADSLTEMAEETARSYCAAINDRARLFLSINHETNAFTVHDLCADLNIPQLSRSPYWMRRGYVEELFQRLSTAEFCGF